MESQQHLLIIFNEEEVEAAFQENTKALFIETLGNPNSDVVDVEKYAKIAHAHKSTVGSRQHICNTLSCKTNRVRC